MLLRFKFIFEKKKPERLESWNDRKARTTRSAGTTRKSGSTVRIAVPIYVLTERCTLCKRRCGSNSHCQIWKSLDFADFFCDPPRCLITQRCYTLCANLLCVVSKVHCLFVKKSPNLIWLLQAEKEIRLKPPSWKCIYSIRLELAPWYGSKVGASTMVW